MSPSYNAGRTVDHIAHISRDDLIESATDDTFREWFEDRQTAENVLEGQSYFNKPPTRKEPDRHSPSQLRQCKRKMSYRRQNAPQEGEKPDGIFWTGSAVEEQLVVPYLQDVVTTGDTYVANSLWVDFEVDVDGSTLRVRGSTDPAIVTAIGEPLLVFEVKSTTSIDRLEEPKTRHRAQLQAYLYGLDREYDHAVVDGVVFYVSRETLAVKTFHEPFNPDFWADTTQWMGELTEHETAGNLPPADPETSWECGYCSFRNRCGEADTPFSDVGYDGLLPLFDEYDRQNLEEYLQAHEEPEARLTPSLAHKHLDLVERYGAYDWSCVACGATYEWEAVNWDGNVDDPPFCPACIETGDMVTLSGPEPDDQLS